jgi:hypothetical protein
VAAAAEQQAAAAASSANISTRDDAPPLTSTTGHFFTNLLFRIGSIFSEKALVVCKKMEVSHVNGIRSFSTSVDVMYA